MKDSNLYYYNQLSKQQQKAYHAMKVGLLAIAPSFPVPRLEGRELLDIFFLLRLVILLFSFNNFLLITFNLLLI